MCQLPDCCLQADSSLSSTNCSFHWMLRYTFNLYLTLCGSCITLKISGGRTEENGKKEEVTELTKEAKNGWVTILYSTCVYVR